jgi:hypothetical protein
MSEETMQIDELDELALMLESLGLDPDGSISAEQAGALFDPNVPMTADHEEALRRAIESGQLRITPMPAAATGPDTEGPTAPRDVDPATGIPAMFETGAVRLPDTYPWRRFG